MSGGQPGSKLIVYERYPAPVFTSLHWRAEGATQKCCSIKGTSKLLRRRHKLRPALYSDPASPSEDLSSIARQLPAPPMRILARWAKRPFDVSIQLSARMTPIRGANGSVLQAVACPNEVWPDVSAAGAASLTRKPSLKVRQPDIIRPPVPADRRRMAAPEIRAIDQETTNA
jgi:hypothetical protein